MKLRPISWCVSPETEPTFSELSYTIRILDEGCGEYLQVEDSNGKIDFNAQEWPHLRDAIEVAIKQMINHP
jgi:hypothetical protein